MTSAIGRAGYAIGNQMQRFERSAARVARSGSADYVQETVEQLSAEHAVKANVAVIRATDQVVGTLATDQVVGTLFDIIA